MVSMETTCYLFDINGETKFIFSDDIDVEKLHDEVYNKDCEFIWKLEVNRKIIDMIELPGINKYSFYSCLETIDIQEFKSEIISLNKLFNGFSMQKNKFYELFKTAPSKPANHPIGSFLNRSSVPILKKPTNPTKDQCDNLEKMEVMILNNKNNLLKTIDFEEENLELEKPTKYKTPYSYINGVGNTELVNHSDIKSIFVYYNNKFDEVYVKRTQFKSRELSFFPEISAMFEVKGFDKNLKDLECKLVSSKFVDIEQLNEFIKDYTIQQKEMKIEENVETFLLKKYEITEESEHKIQFTVLYLKIIDNFDKDYHVAIKNFLPKVLKKIGLQKKRLGKGMFWFGLKNKTGTYVGVDTVDGYDNRAIDTVDGYDNRAIDTVDGYDNRVIERDTTEFGFEINDNFKRDVKLPLVHKDNLKSGLCDYNNRMIERDTTEFGFEINDNFDRDVRLPLVHKNLM
jgi:hypothetical protein